MYANENLIIAIDTNEVEIISLDEPQSFSDELIKILKKLLKNFANVYKNCAVVDNELIQFINYEIFKAKITYERRHLAEKAEEMKEYYETDKELTAFTVFDDEPFYEYE